MTYEEAIDFIDQSNQYGCVPGLTTITELLSRLGNPQEQLRIIHVAGTNGKGSTSSFITSILNEAGYRIGRYVSPAVFSYRERIQITEKQDNLTVTEYITKQGVCDTIKRIIPECEAMVSNGFSHPTSFEIETAMTMLYLQEKQVDFAVIEVGMGGRLDATNVIKHPICSVITSISMDHMQYLGDTLEKIAYEKAGIIKDQISVITCNQASEVIKVIKETCDNRKAPCYISDDNAVTELKYTIDNTEFVLRDKIKSEHYILQMLGEYQVQNALLAMKTAKVIVDLGYQITEQAIKQGLFLAKWSGRFEVLARKPYFIIDGAHNEDAALTLRKSIEMYFNNRRKIFIIGVLADKDYKSILKIVAPLADVIFTMTPDNMRALDSEQLRKEALLYCSNTQDAKTIENAVNLAYKEAKEEDIMIAFGSLSFLGDLVNALGIRKDDEVHE